MNDPKWSQENEQVLAYIGDVLPRMWRSIYEGCIREGFTEQQAMEIVSDVIKTPVVRE